MAELNLNKLKVDKPRFNSIEKLAEVVDEQKMPMFTHKAKKIVILAAKDSGKSFPVELYKAMCMERDPMASALTLMKYATGASKRGIRAFNKAYSELKRKYTFPEKYEPSSSFMYKKKDKKNNLNNQSIEYGSFENSDSLASYVISNGGYPFLIHIEEPVMQGDNDVTTDKQWKADIKTIEDTVKRHWRDYNLSDPETRGSIHPPIPFKTIITMNDWQPTHYVSRQVEKFMPQMDFLDWALGVSYSKLLKLWVDKIDGETVVDELKTVIDENWEKIKINVLNNHTKYVYVDKDEQGIKIDTLFGRMTKFGNPVARSDEETREEIYDTMYRALITGDTLELARAFGMGYGGTLDDERRFNFKKFVPKDTKKILAEERRQLLGFSVGWDHDANRGPVATPTTMSGKIINVGNAFEPKYEYRDVKWLVHEQIPMEGYGKGKGGSNTLLYHQWMLEISKDLYDQYVGNKRLKFGSHVIFDDDDGSYASKLIPELAEYGYNDPDIIENKNGTIENGGYGTVARDKLYMTAIDLDEIIIDKNNEMLVEWFKQVPTDVGANGEKKRSTSGQWGKRYKDMSNSLDYAIWPWRYMILTN